MANRNQNPWLRPFKALLYSLAGLRSTFIHEQAFRQELLVLIIIFPLGLWLGDNILEQLLLIGSWILVMIVELINSAVEAAVDRISMEDDELVGRAKDMGSAAVFITIVLSILTWMAILGQQ